MMAKSMKTLQLYYPMIQFLISCLILCYVVLCCAMLRSVLLFFAMFSYVALCCYVVLYCAMFATLKCGLVIVNRVDNLLRIH